MYFKVTPLLLQFSPLIHQMNTIINTITHYLFVLLVLGYILYEELVWERFAKPIVRYVQSLKLLQKLENALQSVNGTVILVMFVVLFVLTEVSGFYGGTLLIRGQIFLWILLYAVKIPVAAFTFWLFRVTKPKLMAFAWFERAYNFIMKWIDWLKSTEIYIEIKTKSAKVKKYLKRNYMGEGDSVKMRASKIYRRLKIRIKGLLK